MQLDLLAASDGGPKKTIETVAVARLAHSRFNTRRSREAADVEALAERIARNGFEITRAPWAYPANGGFEVFAGGTRYEAARKAAVAEIPIVVHRGFTDDQIARLADEDNENDEYHRPVGVLDVWAEYHRLWKEEGWTQQRIADAKGVQRDLVTRRCGWHEDLCEAARAAVCNGTFDEGHAKAVSEVCVTLHTDALSPWLTTTAAQTEFVAALLKSAKKKDGKPSVSVKDVRAAAQPWKDTIAAAQDGWTELAASDDADDDGKKYAERWQTAFVDALVKSKARDVLAVKGALSAVRNEIAWEKASEAAKAKAIADAAETAKKVAEEEAERAKRAAAAFRVVACDVAALADTIGDGTVDVILTDPPYPREYLPVFEVLAEQAARVLKPGGSCFVMIGQSYLPEIVAALGRHLKYHWTICYSTPGGQAVQLWDREVNTFWKPVLWFTNGDRTDDDWLGDVAKSDVNDNDKRFHFWGQSESGMADLVKRCTKPGQTVCDPFCGGGATGVAALAERRLFVGCDVAPECVETTAKRCREVVDAW